MRRRCWRRPGEPSLPVAARVVVAGAGLDLITARELALKIAEGARIPTAAFQLETLLHGHLAGEDYVDRRGGRADRRGRRPGGAAGRPGCCGIEGDRHAGRSRSARRRSTGSIGALARLLWGAISLQRLTLALAAARGVNPDLIRREEEPWRRAGDVAEGAGDW